MILTASQSTGLGAGAILYCPQKDSILLGLRSATSDAPHTWCCFGGGIEKGETLEEGVSREFKEEFGAAISTAMVPVYATSIRDENNKEVFRYTTFLSIVNREVDGSLNDEHDSYGWFNTQDLPSPLHPEFAKALASLVQLKRMLINMRGV